MSDAPATVATDCPTCGAPFVPGDRFCESCGNDLPGAATGPLETDVPAGLDDSARMPGPGQSVADHLTCSTCGGVYEDGWCTTCGAKAPAARDHIERELPGVAGVTDRGLHHRRNEDAMALRRVGDLVAVVIGDGVSSTVDPHLASEAAAEAAAESLIVDQDLIAAHRLAQDAAAAVPHVAHADLGSPSTTFMAAVVQGMNVSVGSLGDCRAFWLTASNATLLTADDSWAHEQVRLGLLTREAAMADRRAHVITRWLGLDADPEWEPTVRSFTASEPGRLVLCSDGLWNYAPEPADLLAARDDLDVRLGDPIDVAAALVEYANSRGGRDNITVVIVDVPPPPVTAATDAAADAATVAATDAAAPEQTEPDLTEPDEQAGNE